MKSKYFRFLPQSSDVLDYLIQSSVVRLLWYREQLCKNFLSNGLVMPSCLLPSRCALSQDARCQVACCLRKRSYLECSGNWAKYEYAGGLILPGVFTSSIPMSRLVQQGGASILTGGLILPGVFIVYFKCQDLCNKEVPVFFAGGLILPGVFTAPCKCQDLCNKEVPAKSPIFLLTIYLLLLQLTPLYSPSPDMFGLFWVFWPHFI